MTNVADKIYQAGYDEGFMNGQRSQFDQGASLIAKARAMKVTESEVPYAIGWNDALDHILDILRSPA